MSGLYKLVNRNRNVRSNVSYSLDVHLLWAGSGFQFLKSDRSQIWILKSSLGWAQISETKNLHV